MLQEVLPPNYHTCAKECKKGFSVRETKLDRRLGEERTRENMQGAGLSVRNRESLLLFFGVLESIFFRDFPQKKYWGMFKHSLGDALRTC
jgi:hypothetical protein